MMDFCRGLLLKMSELISIKQFQEDNMIKYVQISLLAKILLLVLYDTYIMLTSIRMEEKDVLYCFVLA